MAVRTARSGGKQLPPVLADKTFSIYENNPFSVRVGAFDPNPGDVLTYSIVSGNDDGRFTIDPLTGVITLSDGGTLDYESQSSYALVVQVTDDAKRPATVTATVTIDVVDINDAPTAIALSNVSVAETTAGAAVGTLTVSDQDDPAGIWGQHTLTVDDARFEAVDGVLKLKDGVALDFETEPAVTVTVTAIDGGGVRITETFDIAVTNVDEGPLPVVPLSRLNGANGFHFDGEISLGRAG